MKSILMSNLNRVDRESRFAVGRYEIRKRGTPMRPMIEIAHLSKRFGSIEAVRDLSFTVREGELFAFLGINGAGKSTTISILCGRLRQDAGEVRIDGKSMEQDKRRALRHHGNRVPQAAGCTRRTSGVETVAAPSRRQAVRRTASKSRHRPRAAARTVDSDP